MIERKINVILDLDSTLLCSVPLNVIEMNPEVFKELNEKLKYVDMKPFYRVYLRPHLDEFLDFLFDEFNVSVFTAAERDYAKFVVDNIVKKNHQDYHLDFIFYSYHNMISLRTYNQMKQLSMLWNMFNMYYFYPSNTVIIDDYDMVKRSNPYNCLQIKKFDINLETAMKNKDEILQDKSLLNVAKKLFLMKNMFEKKIDAEGVLIDIKTPILLRDYDVKNIF
jgi:hypothetical protein